LSDTHFENPVGFDARSHHMGVTWRGVVSTEHASIFTP
jgi:hypothetical protein